MRPLSLNRIKHALLFLGALLIGFNVEAQPECRDIDGLRYCNNEYWFGTTRLVLEERVSSLPSGEVTITERNHCPASYKGGTLGLLQQGPYDRFTSATLIDGEIWMKSPFQYPPGVESQATGQRMTSSWPNIQLFGRTVTYKNIFSTAVYFYDLQCTYNNCTELASVYDPYPRCGREIVYLVGINASSGVDLALGAISIPGANINVNDGLPIIPVGVQTQINVPVSINFVGSLPSSVLNLSVPLTLQVGSNSYTQNISITSLAANQNQKSVPFLVTFQSSEAGLKTLVATVNADRSISESNFSNNEAQLNVRVGEKLYLVTTLLNINSQPLAGAEPTKLAISGRETVKLTLGALSSLKLADADGKNIEAKFQVVSGSQSPNLLERGKTLFFERVAILFTGNTFTLKQDIMPVHLGTQEMRITPLDTKYPPLTVVLSVGRPGKLGDKNNDFDQLIIDFANERGLPPQLIKAQIAQESTENFKENAFRYEALSWDLRRFSSLTVPLADHKRFKNFKLTDSLNIKLLSKVFPRKIYKVLFNGILLNNIPDDYESSVEPGKYTPLLARDIVASNQQQNWITPNIPELDGDGIFADFVIKTEYRFIAQTILASSYGLMQIMYPTAVDCCKYKDENGVGLDPIGLLDPNKNVSCGTLYLVTRFISVNNFQQGMNLPLFSNYESALRNALESYNGGRRNPEKDGEKNYNSNVWNRVFNYWPSTEESNF